jgi:hypothetical protein
MIKMLMPMSTHERVTPSAGRDRVQQVSAGSTGAVSFLRLLVTEPAYDALTTQLVPTDLRTAVRNGNSGLRTWSPPV